MTKEYGVDLAPEPLMAAQTIILPTGAKEWAEKHLEHFDAKKHNTKVVVAEPLPIDAPDYAIQFEPIRKRNRENA